MIYGAFGFPRILAQLWFSIIIRKTVLFAWPGVTGVTGVTVGTFIAGVKYAGRLVGVCMDSVCVAAGVWSGDMVVQPPVISPSSSRRASRRMNFSFGRISSWFRMESRSAL